jgi:hypothetical protein
MWRSSALLAILVAMHLAGNAARAETFATSDRRVSLNVEAGWEQIAKDAAQVLVLNCAGAGCIKNSRIYASAAVFQNLIGGESGSFFEKFTVEAFNERALKSLGESRLIGASEFVSRDVWPGYVGAFSVGNGRAIAYFTGFDSRIGAVATVRMFVPEGDIASARPQVVAISRTVDVKP